MSENGDSNTTALSCNVYIHLSKTANLQFPNTRKKSKYSIIIIKSSRTINNLTRKKYSNQYQLVFQTYKNITGITESHNIHTVAII